MAEQKKNKIWRIPENTLQESRVAALAAELSVSPVLASLLILRGYGTAEEAKRFVECTDAVLHKPFLMKDMDKAAARVLQALDSGERIAIFGDYDVDGVTAVSLLYLYLTGLGADVCYYIPSRTGEGYGLSIPALDKLAGEGIGLIITVDTGITAVEEAAYAASLGMDMVITDHHECRLPLPEAVAVVDPHRPDCPYPFKELAGVGVAFKLAAACESLRALRMGEREVIGVRRVAMAYADLVAIGTVADVMPIVDENRVMVKFGIEQLQSTERPGLAALMEEVSAAGRGDTAKKRKITAAFIGFTLAPRINAAGRMSDAALAVELLLSQSTAKARELAVKLCEINQLRQIEENRMAEEVFARIEEELDLANTEIIVLEGDNWRQGVIGIVASRVTERYGKPAILITFDGAEGEPSRADQGKGSGRSIKGVNLVEALSDSAELLVKFGGHELAAGLTVRRDRVADFRRRINEYARANAPAGGAQAVVDVDMELPLSAAVMPLAEEISLLEPFGVSNPTPRFLLRDLTVERITELGGGRHMKLTVSRDGRSLFALMFSTSRSNLAFGEGDLIDLVATLDINEFRDIRSVQLTVVDARPSASFSVSVEEGRARYRALRAGAPFDEAEGVFPTREQFVGVYTVLRREFRRGRSEYTDAELFALMQSAEGVSVTYPALRYILDIFLELQICGVEEFSPNAFRFDICYRAEKANIERSSILKRLRAQSRNK